MPSPRQLLPALIASLACWLSASPAAGYEPRVTDDFFGVSAPELYTLSGQSRDAELNAQLTGIKGAGLDWVRAEIGWADIEPSAPVGGHHNYDWTRGDRFVRSLANKGLSLTPMLMGTPSWARSPAAVAAGCGRSAGVSPLNAGDYGAFARKVVERYGPGGAFWSENPSLPVHPITRVELFNEPNWAPFWCPGPDPVGYGLAVDAAGAAIHAAQPDTVVIAGGLVAVKPGEATVAAGQSLDVDGFLAAITTAAPTITQNVDAVAVHLYHPDPDVNIGLLGWFRARLDVAGFESAEIVVSEFGWRTSGGGSGAVSEETRAQLYQELAGEYARTDCGVIGIAAHSWTTPETNANDPEHWFGISNPSTGALYPSALAYKNEVARYEGRGSAPAPREIIPVCGRGAPDSDGDGVLDPDDDYPTDPGRDSGSTEEPPTTPEPPQPEYGPRVEDGFFGVAAAEIPWELEPRRAHLDSMGDLGIQQARVMVEWSHLQPTANGPTLWDETDALTLQLAKRGIVLAPYFGSPPAWAVNGSDWRDPYLDFLGDYAERYAEGGTFWEENGHLDPDLAPEDFEITPIGNSQAHWWQGSQSPAAYADLILAAQGVLAEASPGARAVLSFFHEGDRGTASSVIRSMVEARPSLNGSIDGVYVFSNSPSQASFDGTTAQVRAALDETGNSRASIQMGFGWPTRGEGAISEEERADRVATFTSRLARSDCGVSRVFPYAWMTGERNDTNQFEWYGMTAPADGAPRATARAYQSEIERFTGFGSEPPPRTTVHICGKPEPDRDSDGIPDSEDDFPVDPERFDGEPPEIEATLKQRKRGANVTVSFAAVDRSELESFECKLDGGAWSPCGSPYTAKKLRPGGHTIRVAASDEWDNRGEVTKRWKARR